MASRRRTQPPSRRRRFSEPRRTCRSQGNNKRWPDFRAGNAITVRRDSGVVVVDGRTAVSHENGFPPFNANEHYILFSVN
jgi:hypothetical protein